MLRQLCVAARGEQSVEKKPGSILTIRKLATCVEIPKSGLYKIVQKAKIPGKKLDPSLRMHRLRPTLFNGMDAIFLPKEREAETWTLKILENIKKHPLTAMSQAVGLSDFTFTDLQ